MKILILCMTIFLSGYSIADVKVAISNSKGKQYRAKFKTQELADIWIADNKANSSWGDSQDITIAISDITQEMADAASLKEVDRLERIEIKGYKQVVIDYDKKCLDKNGKEIPLMPGWLKKMHKKYLKDMRNSL